MKISKIMLIVGIIALIASLTCLIISSIDYNKNYSEWNDAFMNNPMIGFKDKPTDAFIVLSAVATCFSVILFIIGLSPYISKLSLKHKKEILEYTGEDVQSVGTTMVDIGQPIVNKDVDDIVAPNLKNIKKSLNNKNTEENTHNEKIYCKFCGKTIDKDSKFCSYCGKEQ